jgi:hypothetical protein
MFFVLIRFSYLFTFVEPNLVKKNMRVYNVFKTVSGIGEGRPK